MPMSNSRGFVVKVGHVLLLLLLMLLLVPQHPAQEPPPHSNSDVNENELSTFHNGHLMVKGKEIRYYLKHETLRNVILDFDGGPILIVVTPCASSVTWTLIRKPTRKRTKGRGRLWREQQKKKRVILRKFTGDTRESFVQVNAPAGIYKLAITALDRDSWVKVFVTYDPDVRGSIYPEVPPNHQVRAQAKKRTIRLEWPSGLAVNHKNPSVEYCVTISRIRNFHTHCGALAYLRGDEKPTFAEWGFPDENKTHEELSRQAKPVQAAPSWKIFQQCVGNKTSFTHSKVRRGKTYYIDVFIRDKSKNTASSYKGTSVTIKKRKRSPVKMEVGDTKTINLKRRMGVQLTLKAPERRLAFEVIPCTVDVSFELYHNGTRIRKKTRARHWKRHFIRNAAPGTYLMTFPDKKKKRKKKTFVTVFITSKPSRSKVAMPKKEKRDIFTFKKLTTCSSVTIAWNVEPVDQKFCLYRKKLRKIGEKVRDSKRRRCLSPTERPVSERVTCMDHRAATNKTQITHVMSSLRRNTLYRFDVFLSRKRSASVPYKSVRAKTSEHCIAS